MLQRGGEVVIRMLSDVQQRTIAPLMQRTIAPGSTVYTDEYQIYHRLSAWGDEHQSVNHSAGEYARDDDGDGLRRSPRQHHGRLLELAAFVVTATSRHLTGESPFVFRLL